MRTRSAGPSKRASLGGMIGLAAIVPPCSMPRPAGPLGARGDEGVFLCACGGSVRLFTVQVEQIRPRPCSYLSAFKRIISLTRPRTPYTDDPPICSSTLAAALVRQPDPIDQAPKVKTVADAGQPRR